MVYFIHVYYAQRSTGINDFHVLWIYLNRVATFAFVYKLPWQRVVLVKILCALHREAARMNFKVCFQLFMLSHHL